MPKRKLDPAAVSRARDLMREGRTPAQIEEATGISEGTIRAWAKKANSPPVNGSSSPDPARVKAVPVPPGGGQPPKGGGGYDAARAAAGAAPPPPGGASGPPPGVDPVLALIMTTDLALSVSCRFYAMRLRCKWDDEIAKFSHLSNDEKSQLMMYGPFVAPFLSEFLLKYGKYIGPAIYGLAFYNMLLMRFQVIKEKAPPPPKKEADKEVEKERKSERVSPDGMKAGATVSQGVPEVKLT